jgi:hypothetical protein
MNDLENLKLINEGKICPYCTKPTEYVDIKEVKRKSSGMIYLCRSCNAYVGVHKGTDQALGRLANAELRKAKMEAHYWFDQIARTKVINEVWPVFIKGASNRSKSYLWLSKHLGISVDKCHIGMFDVEMCERVKEISKTAMQNHEYGRPTRPPEVNNIDKEFFKD